MAFLQCTIQRSGTRGNDGWCDDDARNCGRHATEICYLLMTRLQNRCVVRGYSRDGFGWVGGADVGDGANHIVWSGDDNSVAVHSDAASDCGGGDSGGRLRKRQSAVTTCIPKCSGCCHEHFRFIPVCIGISLELLEKAVFPFASRGTLEYLMGVTSHTGPPFS